MSLVPIQPFLVYFYTPWDLWTVHHTNTQFENIYIGSTDLEFSLDFITH